MLLKQRRESSIASRHSLVICFFEPVQKFPVFQYLRPEVLSKIGRPSEQAIKQIKVSAVHNILVWEVTYLMLATASSKSLFLV